MRIDKKKSATSLCNDRWLDEYTKLQVSRPPGSRHTSVVSAK